jgi:flagellar biosynthesis protein FlhF
MNMKRYQARDMRSAMRQIRDEQGPEAIIISSRRTAEGVEVVAVLDIEVVTQQQAEELASLAADAPLISDSPPAEPVAAASESTSDAVTQELRSLRLLLEKQVAALSWNEFSRREPLRVRVLRDLTELGVSRDIAISILNELPAVLSAEQAQRLPLGLLARRIFTCPYPVEAGGLVMLHGPSGCGKTTLLGKLAASWTLEHDPTDVAIVSADEDRIGAHEQIRTVGRLLGIRVWEASSSGELIARLEALSHKRLVLIDTSGAASRGGEPLEMLRAVREAFPAMRCVAVLPASAQIGVLEASLDKFKDLAPQCCALTRLDEVASLGGTLSLLARTGLPVACTSDGARIPEDLRPARAHQLVVQATELARLSQSSVDEELLAHRYGGSVNAAA